MKIIKYIPSVLSFMILAAHFSRGNMQLLTVLSLLLPFLLFIKKKAVLRILQIVLIIGAAEWIRSMFEYINIRSRYGADWTTLAVILSSVAMFTLFSALFFESKVFKKVYK